MTMTGIKVMKTKHSSGCLVVLYRDVLDHEAILYFGIGVWNVC